MVRAGVQVKLSIVLKHPANMIAKEFSLLIHNPPHLLRRVYMKFDILALRNKPGIDEELFAIAYI